MTVEVWRDLEKLLKKQSKCTKCLSKLKMQAVSINNSNSNIAFLNLSKAGWLRVPPPLQV